MRRYLLVAYFDYQGLETIKESVECWRYCQSHEVEVLNLWKSGRLCFPPDLVLSKYDGVILHNTISYNPENIFALDGANGENLRTFQGRKILLKQDEHLKSAITDDAIVNLKFDVVFTLTEPSLRDRFYPKSVRAGVEFVFWLTGYVSERLKKLNVPKFEMRNFDLIYRGSLQPESFGRLAHEKALIADRANSQLKNQGLRLDISNRWEDRKFGSEWYRFLGSSVGSLGVESGASIIDPHGRLYRFSERLKRTLPAQWQSSIRQALFLPWEEDGIYSALAPRHLEAIATRTVQFMYPGKFSGILSAGEHYFAISREQTDWQEVVERLKDRERIQKLADFAYKEIIESGRYSYHQFVRLAESKL